MNPHQPLIDRAIYRKSGCRLSPVLLKLHKRLQIGEACGGGSWLPAKLSEDLGLPLKKCALLLNALIVNCARRTALARRGAQ